MTNFEAVGTGRSVRDRNTRNFILELQLAPVDHNFLKYDPSTFLVNSQLSEKPDILLPWPMLLWLARQSIHVKKGKIT